MSSFLLVAAVGCGSSEADSASPPGGSSPPGGENQTPNGDDGVDTDPIDAPPTRPEDVISLYDRMGNACNDGRIVRTFAEVTRIDANNLWTTPNDDAAALASPKLTTGWGSVVAVSKLVFEGLSDDMQTTSAEQAARCGSASDIFTPLARGERSTFTNVLLYADEHAHVDAFPSPEASLDPVDAPVRLKGYLDVSSGQRRETGDVVSYADVATQHVPIYVSCEKPLRVVRELRTVPKTEADHLDRSTCRLDASEESYSCVFERVEHVAENRCTFVAVDVRFRAAERGEQRLSLGGRLEAGPDAPLRYRATIDRFAFNADR